MDSVSIHELTAAYALDALEPDEAQAYEAHLRDCERCRTELASLREGADALAWGVESPAPPARLRASILDAAGAERENVVPLVHRSRLFRVTAAVAAVAACAARRRSRSPWRSRPSRKARASPFWLRCW